MGVPKWLRSVGNFFNTAAKKTKIASTLAPMLIPGVAGQALGKLAANAGYAKGGRVKPRGMKKGGKVGRPKKAGRPKKK